MAFNERGANVIDGAFGENLVVEGIDFSSLPWVPDYTRGCAAGDDPDRERNHSHCAIYKRMGECIMPKEGVFARVIREGIIRPGDVMRVEPPAEERPFTAAVPLPSATRAPEESGRTRAVLRQRRCWRQPGMRWWSFCSCRMSRAS